MTKKTNFHNSGVTVFGEGKTVNVRSYSAGDINYVSDPMAIFGDFDLVSFLGVDSNWYSNNIYYIDDISGNVFKKNFNGGHINSIQLNNARFIDLISPAPRVLKEYDGIEEVGFWVCGSDSIYKIDEDFNVLFEIEGVNPEAFVSTLDGGCVFYEINSNKMVKYSSDGILTSWLDNSNFSFPLNTNENVIDIKRGINNHFWVLSSKSISKLKYEDGVISETYSRLIENVFNSTVGDVVFDVDLSFEDQEKVFILNFANGYSSIVELDGNGIIIKSVNSLNIENPITIKNTQLMNSKGMYVLSGGIEPKITKLNKDSIQIVGQEEIPLESVNGMTINHFADITNHSLEIPFSFSPVSNNLPHLQEEEYVVVIREKVNFSDNTPSEIQTKNNGKIKGQKNYKESIPYGHKNGIAIFKELRGVK